MILRQWTPLQTPEKENKFRTAVEKLRDTIEGYNTAVDEKADQKTIEEHEQKVVQALKETAESSPNPQVKEYYKAKVLEFMKVGSTAKKYLTNDLVRSSVLSFLLKRSLCCYRSKGHFLSLLRLSRFCLPFWYQQGA